MFFDKNSRLTEANKINICIKLEKLAKIAAETNLLVFFVFLLFCAKDCVVEVEEINPPAILVNNQPFF